MAQLFDDVIFTLGPVTINGVVYHGGKTPYGFLRAAYNDDLYAGGTPPTPIPEYAIDPPVPPVWPILGSGKFSSDTIYGSERMNSNLVMVRGNTYSFNAIAVLNDAVLDLINYTVRMTVKKNLNDTSNFFQLTSPSNGIVVTSTSTGQFTCTIAGSLTSGLPAYTQRFPYSIDIVNGTIIHTLIRGYLTIVPVPLPS